MFLYIGRMDWRAGHLTIIVGTGRGVFANKNCPQGRAFDSNFFKGPGFVRGFARRGDACGWNLLARVMSSTLIESKVQIMCELASEPKLGSDIKPDLSYFRRCGLEQFKLITLERVGRWETEIRKARESYPVFLLKPRLKPSINSML